MLTLFLSLTRQHCENQPPVASKQPPKTQFSSYFENLNIQTPGPKFLMQLDVFQTDYLNFLDQGLNHGLPVKVIHFPNLASTEICLRKIAEV